jgi:triosephosphate isomerase
MLAINLKMHLNKREIEDFENYIYNKKIIVLPEYPYIPFFQRGEYLLGSQDVSKFKEGAYTGEIPASCLKSFGCKYALIGHSERKYNFNEDLSILRDKIQNVLDEEMIPIYCVDRTLNDIENDPELKNIETQLEAIPDYVKYIIIVFEPSYIIGNTEMVPDLDEIQKTITKIKEWLIERNINHSILYGGGVSKKNVNEIMNIRGVDGTIICSSAFSKEDFDYIYDKCVENKS